jgi:hypothetical protein
LDIWTYNLTQYLFLETPDSGNKEKMAS